MREGVERLAHDDAPETVDGGAAGQPLEQPLVAQQVDQGDARQQRRGEQRQQSDGAKEPLARQARARQAVGESVGAGHDQQHRDDAHRQAARDHAQETVAADDAGDHRQAGPIAVAVGHGLGQDRHERQRQEHQQAQRQRALPARQAGGTDPGRQGAAAQRWHRGRGRSGRVGCLDHGGIKRRRVSHGAAAPPSSGWQREGPAGHLRFQGTRWNAR
ncbi:hypothetical protein FQZ97_583980 [compost metagenome]